MGPPLLLMGQSASLAAKIIVGTMMLHSYAKHGRKTALYWALAWTVSMLFPVSDLLGFDYGVSLSMALFSSLLLYGAISLLEPHEAVMRLVKLLPVIPVFVALYGALFGIIGLTSDWYATVGIPYGVSGLFIVLAGYILFKLSPLHEGLSRTAGVLLGLLGLHFMDYPVLRWNENFAPAGFWIGAVLTVLTAYSMAKLALAGGFSTPTKSQKTSLSPGAHLVDERRYAELKKELEEIPILAFVRTPKVPPAWNSFFVTTVPAERSISPTNLAKMADMAARYFREVEKGGILLIDCPEYLKTYNGFEALVKFLSQVKDMAILHEGALIIVLHEEAWPERELNLLKRLLL